MLYCCWLYFIDLQCENGDALAVGMRKPGLVYIFKFQLAL